MSGFSETSVADFMSSPVLTVGSDASLGDAYSLLLSRGVSCLAVVDDSQLVGVVSRTDLLREGRRVVQDEQPRAQDVRHTLLKFENLRVADVMTSKVCTLLPESDIAQAGAMMAERGVHRILIVREGQLLGVFSTLDAMRAIAAAGASESIHLHASTPVVSVDVHDPLSVAVDRLQHSNVSGLIVAENDWPIGVFTQVEALLARSLPESTLVEDAMDPAVICLPATATMRRAAQQGIRMRVRRIVACEHRDMQGVLSGLDFAAFVAGAN